MTDGTTRARPPAGSVQTFNCPSCGGTVVIRAAGITVTAVCQSCGSLIDAANENYTIIKKAAVKVRPIPLPLGSRGTLLGTLWEVIGYCEKTDQDHYSWREYLLFNPYQGFSFLVEFDGHWSLLRMLRKSGGFDGTDNTMTYRNRRYHIFGRGTASVTYVMGEFYWRVKVGDKENTADYVDAPYVLSMEKSDGEIIWSEGEYITREDIARAFNVAESALPQSKGVGACQPWALADKFKPLMVAALGFLVGLFVLHVVFDALAEKKVVYEKHAQVMPMNKGQAVTDAFEIPPGMGNLKVNVQSPVYNDWLELNMSLVEDATQKTTDFIEPIEYYSGYDSDGNWSEGSQSRSDTLSSIPGGKYHLVVETDSGQFLRNGYVDYNVKLVRNAPMWENFLSAAFMLLLYPLYVLLRRWNFETRRWSNSDYTSGGNLRTDSD